MDPIGVVIRVAGPTLATERTLVSLRQQTLPPAAIVLRISADDPPGALDELAAGCGARIVAADRDRSPMVAAGDAVSSCKVLARCWSGHVLHPNLLELTGRLAATGRGLLAVAARIDPARETYDYDGSPWSFHRLSPIRRRTGPDDVDGTGDWGSYLAGPASWGPRLFEHVQDQPPPDGSHTIGGRDVHADASGQFVVRLGAIPTRPREGPIPRDLLGWRGLGTVVRRALPVTRFVGEKELAEAVEPWGIESVEAFALLDAHPDWRRAGWIDAGELVLEHARTSPFAATFAVSAAIPVRDRPAALLRAALRGLARQTVPPTEVVVVDQASGPAHAASYRALEGEFPGLVRVVRTEGPARWNKPMASNLAIRTTRSPYVLAMDGDLIFHPRAFELFRAHELIGSTVIVGAIHKLPWLAADPALFDALPWESWALGAEQYGSDAHGWHFFPRAWIDKVRGYDERMFGRGCMDVDLSERAQRDPDVRYVRLGGHVIVLHHPHESVAWNDSLRTDETRSNLAILTGDPSVVRNDDRWGLAHLASGPGGA
jgi:hypothetical protein